MAGVDYIFAVLGSDHPSIIEAYVKRKSEKKEWPRMLIFGHEFVAISAADGYARLTGKPQCVLVHVDVGTAAIGQGWHNASSGKVPVLVFAGQAPYTIHGELPGTRSEHVHLYQDVPNQHAIVAPFSRYSNELRMGGDVQLVVNRALLMASTGTPGPVYLTAAREALAAKAVQPTLKNLPSCVLGGIPAAGAKLIGRALVEAKKPLVVTGYLGRSHEAVKQLVKFADLIGCLVVVEAEAREMSFPANHPAWRPQRDASRLICDANVILVLDADVPWIPANLSPISARIFHIEYWAAHQHKTPFLSIILNNGGWKATRRCLNDVHPGGLGTKMSDKDHGIDLSEEGPDYCGIMRAATNGSALTWKVEMGKDLEKTLRDAVDAVKSGRCALVEAVIP